MPTDALIEPDASGTPLPTEPLITVADLGRVAQETIAVDHPYATWVVDAVSILIRAAGDSYWTAATVPPVVRIVALLVAKRAWVNPLGEKSSHTGPIGATVMDIEALGLRLADEELALIHAALPATAAGHGGLWILPTTQGPLESSIYLGDNSGSDWQVLYADAEWAWAFTPRVV